MKQITDLDLAPVYRTQANYWKAQYFQARVELTKANKGLRKLRKRLDKLDENETQKTPWGTIKYFANKKETDEN